jgi:hypothetical protein
MLKEIQFKFDEYVANGAILGFLVHPPRQCVYVYRPNRPRYAWIIPASHWT